MKQILFVDDEQAILRSLARLFYRTGWHMFFAQDGEEAICIMDNHHIDMVISDMRMPSMDGYKLLRLVQQKYPKTIRLILSGYSDERDVYRAVLNGAAKSYLMKPWDAERLLSFLTNLMNLCDTLMEKNYFDHVEGMKPIPTFRCTVDAINKLIDNEGSTSEIAKHIETDPGLTARILQLVNSSSYDRNVGSVKQAVYHMGNGLLYEIINDETYTKIVDIDTTEGKWFGLMKQHAFITNSVMERTVETFMGRAISDTGITASVLHNVGMFMGNTKALPHDELGGYLLRWWGIPEMIAECAFYHHRPRCGSAENQELLGILHLANYYVSEYLQCSEEPLDETVFHTLSIQRKDYENFVKSILSWFDNRSFCDEF